MTEIVLPSGRFAQMRRITWFDRVVCSNVEIEIMVMSLACRITTLDGVQLTWTEAQAMDLCEANPLIDGVLKQLNNAFKSKGIA